MLNTVSVTKTLENYGFQQGDKIISVNGKPIEVICPNETIE